MSLSIQVLPVGPLAVNCSLLLPETGETALVVDPGGDAPEIAAVLQRLGRTLAGILLTHDHYDHIGGTDELRALFPDAPVCASEACADRVTDGALNLSQFILGHPVAIHRPERILTSGTAFTLGGIEILPTEIPGHALGQLVFYVRSANAVCCGDTVFAGAIGRSDLAGGDENALICTLKSYLAALPPETRLYPGHGPSTTAGEELATNPYLQA